MEAAWKAGIVVVCAAGNNGRFAPSNGFGTIVVPGNDPAVITVGATMTEGTATRVDDKIASYSSKGPTTLNHIVKPDLVAPATRKFPCASTTARSTLCFHNMKLRRATETPQSISC